jgi:hypothetical protein
MDPLNSRVTALVPPKLRKWIFYPEGTFRAWTVTVVLLVAAVACYGLYAKDLGFYWDDWGFAWARYFRGLPALITMAGLTRPLRTYYEVALTPLLGVNPLYWQVYALLMRWIAAVALWWCLRQMWKDHPRPIFMVALFYVVYPGFGQQALAMTYQYFWLFQAVFYVSLGLMIWAVHNPRRFWLGMGAAVVLAALQLFSSEYLVGLELLRPIFLWLTLASSVPRIRTLLVRVVSYWAPFLLVLGIYILWRVFVIRFPTYQPVLLGGLRQSPLNSLLGLVGAILHSIDVVMVQAWGNTLQVSFRQFATSRFTLVYFLVVVISLLGLLYYQSQLQSYSSGTITTGAPRKVVGQFIAIGLVAILVGGIPDYLTGLTVEAHFEFDRLSMSYLLGACLLLVGLLELLPHPWQGITLGMVLAALAIGLQIYNSELFRSESDLQKTFAWQMAWRMPGLKPNTLLLYDDPTFPFTDDEGLTYLVNWIYAPENYTEHLPVAIDQISGRLGVMIPSLEKGQPIYQNYYLGADFRSSTDQMVVLAFSPPSCLRVLDPVYDQGLILLPVYKERNGVVLRVNSYVLPSLTASALPLSNMDQIIPDPARLAHPPAFVLGPEPHTTWCYFFEKADLARQTGDWQKIAQLGDEAFSSHYFPSDLSEYLVFVEAYARLGRWQDAEEYAHLASDPAPVIEPAVCAVWDRVERAGPLSEDAGSQLAGLQKEFHCPAAP